MSRRALFIVNSDPRTSARPAEAIRVAAGIGAWQKIHVILCLCETAVLALSERNEVLRDHEQLAEHLQQIAAQGEPIYLETGAPLLQNLGQTPAPYERISVLQLAELAARADFVLRF